MVAAAGQTTPVYEFKAEHIILESRHFGMTSRDVPEQLIPR